MYPQTGTADFDELELFGFYWDELLKNPSWSNRRVESIVFEDESHFRIRVSIDINMPKLRELSEDFDAIEGKFTYVPVLTLDKTPELELDICDGNANVVSAVTSDVSSKVSLGYFLAWQYLYNDLKPTHHVKELLHRVISASDGYEVLMKILRFIDELEMSHQIPGGSDFTLSDDDVECFRKIFGNDESFDLISELSKRRYLLVPIDTSLDFLVVKISRMISSPNVIFPSSPRAFLRRFLTLLGMTPLEFILPAEGIGVAAREHTRVHAPNESKILSSNIVKAKNSRWHTATLPSAQASTRIDDNVVVHYTSGIKYDGHALRFLLISKFWVFFGPAFICSSLLFLFSGIGAYLEYSNHLFTGADGGNQPPPIDASVTILALLPTAFAAFLAHRGEHGIIRKIHAAPRFILLIPAILLIVTAASIATPLPNGTGHVLVSTALLMTAIFSAVSFGIFLIISSIYCIREVVKFSKLIAARVSRAK